MKQISNETACEIKQELEVTYESAIKPYECQIRSLTSEIMISFERAMLNQWAMLETLERVKKGIVDSLGTVVDPGHFDVEAEEERLEELLWKLQKYECIEREFSAIINSPGYRLRRYSEEEIFRIVEQSELYW